MPVDPSLIGRTFPPTPAYEVTEDGIRAFAAAIGAPYDGTSVPPTFPIVLWFEAMNAFLQTEHIELERVIHGEQKFAYERPVVVGDRLTTELTVTSLRKIGGSSIVGTVSEFHDADGALVCRSGATLVHRGADQ